MPDTLTITLDRPGQAEAVRRGGITVDDENAFAVYQTRSGCGLRITVNDEQRPHVLRQLRALLASFDPKGEPREPQDAPVLTPNAAATFLARHGLAGGCTADRVAALLANKDATLEAWEAAYQKLKDAEPGQRRMLAAAAAVMRDHHNNAPAAP
jgi:hypothetical protein